MKNVRFSEPGGSLVSGPYRQLGVCSFAGDFSYTVTYWGFVSSIISLVGFAKIRGRPKPDRC